MSGSSTGASTDVVALGEHDLARECDCGTLPGDSEETCNEPTQIVSKFIFVIFQKMVHYIFDRLKWKK